MMLFPHLLMLQVNKGIQYSQLTSLHKLSLSLSKGVMRRGRRSIEKRTSIALVHTKVEEV